MISSHLPALQVVVPLIAAPVCMLLRHPRLAWGIAALISWVSLGVAIALLARVLCEGPVSYALGGWAAPWGIEYRIDELNALVLIVIAGVSAWVVLFARASVEQEIPPEQVNVFYTLWLLFVTGLLGMVVTGDAFNLFVFLEISSLSSYALVSLAQDRRALTAAYRYLVMGTIGATFILIGIGLLYMMTGTLNMADLARRLPAVADNRTVVVALAFLTVGISLKMALVPLHAWLPNAYTYAPSAVSALLAAASSKVGVYMLLRFSFSILGARFSLEATNGDRLLLGAALLATVFGSVAALFQTNIKSMLAYSSIAQIGYLVLGISLVSLTGLTAGIVHLFSHALTKAGLFMAVGCLAFRLRGVTLQELAGVGRHMPWTMAAFVCGGLSLIGFPLTAGFISKWYLVVAVLERGWWPAAVVILLTSLLAVAYIWRVVEVAYWRPEPEAGHPPGEAPWSMLGPTWVLILANVYVGIQAAPVVAMARRAAETLLSTAP
ncbi:MAG: monovalent cation/H+ antiporter subunit D family protein [Gammaproteobacteria bacterium]